ncbi:MAG TPA: hypothetical protein VMP11_15865 [Verrucomicrobiae bacterium]|nr:hypothetical protein [Verrucomicrobiae bacterium]
MQWVEWIGYAGSVLVGGSLLMSNIWKLRWINLAGALLFTVYGLWVRSYPVVFLNVFIVAADGYWLYRISVRQDTFSLLRVAPERSVFRDEFLNYYRADIARYFPQFDWNRLSRPESVFVLRNLMPVGLFIYEPQPSGVVSIAMDYVIPEYRDLKNARFLYGANQAALRERGFRVFAARSELKAHQTYLRKMGFTRDETDPSCFQKLI